MTLRDEVAKVLASMMSETVADGREFYNSFADRILALPEIAEALKARNILLADQMPDLPQERVGQIMRNLGPSISTGTRRDDD